MAETGLVGKKQIGINPGWRGSGRYRSSSPEALGGPRRCVLLGEPIQEMARSMLSLHEKTVIAIFKANIT